MIPPVDTGRGHGAARWKRHAVMGCCALWLGVARLAQAQTGGQVLHAAELAAAGVTRLGDLLALADGWNTTTLDGHTLTASPSGLAPLQAPAWRVMLDGQPLDLDVLGHQSLNEVPLTLAQIDSVTIHRLPLLQEGVFASAGLIQVHTRRPQVGVAAQGSLSAGNAINDPGPYRYTPLASPNIDRIGPLWQCTTRGATRSWQAVAGYKADQQHVTHPQVERRVYSLYEGFFKPRIVTQAGNLVLERRGRQHRHHLWAGYTRQQDLRFLEPLGRELPLEQRYAMIGLNGGVGTGTNAPTRYRVSVTRTDLGLRPNRQQLDPDWQQDRLSAWVEQGGGSRAVQLTLGAGIAHERTRTRDTLRHPHTWLPQAALTLHTRLARRWSQQTGVLVTWIRGRDGLPDKLGLKGRFLSTTRLRQTQRLDLSAGYAFEAIEEVRPRWYWIAEGYRFFQHAGQEVQLPPFFLGTRTVMGDLVWQARPSRHLGLGASGMIRRFFGQNLASYHFAFNPLTDGFETTTQVAIGVEGLVWGASAEVHLRPGARVQQRLAYTFTRPVAGSQAVFWEAWASQPRHQLGYTLWLAPNPRFSVYGRVRYQSPTLWPSFSPAEAGTGGRFPTRRPAWVLVDVTAQKRLWGEHLRASLSLRNAANAPYRPHPAGATFDMALHAQIEARFASAAR